MILPKEIRDAKRWGPGTEIDVINRPDEVVLRAVQGNKAYNADDLIGCLRKYVLRPLPSVEEIDRRAKEAFAENWLRTERRRPDDRG